MTLLTSLGSPALTRYIEFLRDDATEAVTQVRGAAPVC